MPKLPYRSFGKFFVPFVPKSRFHCSRIKTGWDKAWDKWDKRDKVDGTKWDKLLPVLGFVPCFVPSTSAAPIRHAQVC